ncbi:hypothetical protein SFC79_08605 [Nocardioides sp. S-58]|uniref:Uncharacterized protein n=1 Tax=Nocardioides renjunii TaxID=3095075 RepID=A0ABU5KA20_9ACTN|nr:hypothetical protein [Nocardioides sp. S-58]MDZ5661821.1 hypothetical protein [Nocardioides sp. S-58]
MSARTIAVSAAQGAVLSVWRYVPDAIDVFKEMLARNAEITRALGAGVAGDGPSATDRRRFALARLWCVTVFPVYQVADDIPGYWVYLRMHALLGPLAAYAVTALVALVLAAALGLVQRRVERHRAELVGLRPVDDDTDNSRYLLDAVVMSAPWQVYRRANRPVADGHVGLTPVRRILQYGAVYAVVNTALYAVGRHLPVGDWTGFAIALVAVTALGGAWAGVRNRPHLTGAGPRP